MKKTIYAECGLPASLVPVQFLGWIPSPVHDITGLYNAVVRLKRSAPGYTKGETLRLPARSIVHKAGVRNGFVMVRQAELPARTDENTLSRDKGGR